MARTLIAATVVPALSAFTVTGNTGTSPGASGVGNGILFTNFPGQTLVLVNNGATAASGQITVAIGATILGEAFTSYNIGVGTGIPVSTQWLLGPFYSSFDQAGSNQIAVDFATSVAALTCSVLQLAGVV
jgi:hypothetical protein